jgi:hypothetical protein
LPRYVKKNLKKQILFGFCSGFCPPLADTIAGTTAYPERYDMDKQRPDLNAEYLGPICKFGPGGEYVSNWPMVPQYSTACRENPLGSVLEMIARMIGLTSATPPHRYNQPNIQKIIQKYREKNERAAKQDSRSYAAPIAVVGDHRSFSVKPTLFGDDTGTRLAAPNKPNHRVRASRRAARKRFSVGMPEQGSLFETHLARAKTA